MKTWTASTNGNRTGYARIYPSPGTSIPFILRPLRLAECCRACSRRLTCERITSFASGGFTCSVGVDAQPAMQPFEYTTRAPTAPRGPERCRISDSRWLKRVTRIPEGHDPGSSSSGSDAKSSRWTKSQSRSSAIRKRPPRLCKIAQYVICPCNRLQTLRIEILLIRSERPDNAISASRKYCSLRARSSSHGQRAPWRVERPWFQEYDFGSDPG